MIKLYNTEQIVKCILVKYQVGSLLFPIQFHKQGLSMEIFIANQILAYFLRLLPITCCLLKELKKNNDTP